MKKIIKSNTGFIIIMIFVIIIGIFGITYALSIDNFRAIGINTTTAEIDASILFEDGTSAITNEGNMLPISDTLITGSDIEYTSVLKATFNVTGASSNPENTIFDIVLRNIEIDCELKSEYLKWRLYRDGTADPISEGSFSPSFDAMSNDRLVLTKTQEDLTTSGSKYTLLIWISEACTESNLATCDPSLEQSKYLGKSFSASIMAEVSTKSKKEVVRNTDSNFSCSYTSVAVPTCNTLTYNGSSQVLVAGATGYSLSNSTGTSAGKYAVTATLEDGYIWEDETTNNKIINCSIAKKDLTITTLNQSIVYGNNIASTTDKVSTSGLLSGHSLSTIFLDSTIVSVGTGNIMASNAKIIDSSSNEVTYNYSITYNNSGVVTITSQ